MFMTARCAILGALLLGATAIGSAQSNSRADWLMKNYRFSGPPSGGGTRSADPVLAQLQEIQATTLAILRKANFAGDYEAALAAAFQAASNAQLIGAIIERQ